MAKSAMQLFKEGARPQDIGNPQIRQELRRLQQQNYQAQLQQVNANFQAALDQGLTAGQAATTWVLPTGGNSNYTVKDGDTLPAIAAATGSTPTDILNANPDMRAPQTGMVLNAPPSSNYFNSEKGLNTPASPPLPGTEAWRTQNVGGLPSNGPLGRTSTNRQGRNGFEGTNQSLANQRMNQYADVANTLSNSFQGLNALRQNQMGAPLNGQTATQQFGGLRNLAGQGLDALRTSQMGQTPQPTQNPMAPAAVNPHKTSYAPRGNIVTLLDSITAQVGPNGRLPTDFELKQLVAHGRIRPAKQRATGGGGGGYSSYSSARGRGGGGGGGGGRIVSGGQPRYNTDDNLPAFSNGGGMRGLVNWRI